MSITKKEVLENIDQVKNYMEEIENKEEEKTVGIAIKNKWTGDIIFQSTKTTLKEAIEEKSDTYLRGADLSGANLRGVDLHGADLYDADLHGADLYGADLRTANLHGADLYEADLHGAYLHGADLYNANLSDADLMNAKFLGKTPNPKILTKKQLPDFLKALGFVVED